MRVPKEILAVPRPSNTVVVDRGGGFKRYAVLERKSSVYRPGKSPSPRNGKTIGHIIDSRFIPIDSRPGFSKDNFLSFGIASFVHANMKDVQSELMQLWDVNAVYAIMALVTVRIAKPDIANRAVEGAYFNSFASLYWPGAAVSKNSVGKLLEGLGMDTYKRRDFCVRHLSDLRPLRHILIEGMLESEPNPINTIWDCTYRISEDKENQNCIIYAYSLDKMELIYAETLPDNAVESKAFADFIYNHGITDGLFILNKGFPLSAIAKELEGKPKLHYLLPVGKKSQLIKTYKQDSFGIPLRSLRELGIVGEKVKMSDGRWLYTFRNLLRNAEEAVNYGKKAIQAGTYKEATFQEKWANGEAIGFISDLDMELKEVYAAYQNRWVIKQLLGRYRKGLDGDHYIFTTKGNEFINFLCGLATVRILSMASQAGLLDKMTFGQVFKALSDASRAKEAPIKTEPKKDDGFWENPDDIKFNILMGLGLVEKQKKVSAKETKPEKLEMPKRPRGRPRIHPKKPDGPKRPRGRPRKQYPLMIVAG